MWARKNNIYINANEIRFEEGRARRRRAKTVRKFGSLAYQLKKGIFFYYRLRKMYTYRKHMCVSVTIRFFHVVQKYYVRIRIYVLYYRIVTWFKNSKKKKPHDT